MMVKMIFTDIAYRYTVPATYDSRRRIGYILGAAKKGTYGITFQIICILCSAEEKREPFNGVAVCLSRRLRN
jgi:hypothetical protein